MITANLVYVGLYIYGSGFEEYRQEIKKALLEKSPYDDSDSSQDVSVGMNDTKTENNQTLDYKKYSEDDERLMLANPPNENPGLCKQNPYKTPCVKQPVDNNDPDQKTQKHRFFQSYKCYAQTNFIVGLIYLLNILYSNIDGIICVLYFPKPQVSAVSLLLLIFYITKHFSYGMAVSLTTKISTLIMNNKIKLLKKYLVIAIGLYFIVGCVCGFVLYVFLINFTSWLVQDEQTECFVRKNILLV